MDRIQNYLRTFPELFPNRKRLAVLFADFRAKSVSFGSYIGGALFLYFGVLVIILSLLLLFLYRVQMAASFEEQRVKDNLSYWEKVVQRHPNSPDALYNAAYSAARLGEKHAAVKYIEGSLYLDGDFEEAWDLREEILEL